MPELSQVLLAKALDGLALRQQAIAHNIANAQSPDFAPVRVRFEEALAAAARDGTGAASRVTPTLETGAAGTLRLDLEASDSASTAARYSALIDVLSRQMQIRALATGGR
jgi:flagellar basal-body rod protein FlgB